MNSSQSRRPISLLILGTIAVSVFLMTGSSPSEAHAVFDTYQYSVTSCPASYSKQVDPITIVFTRNAIGTRTFNHIEAHTGWSSPATGSSHQYFASHGYCGQNDEQKATACSGNNGNNCTRYHIRARKTEHADTTWGTTGVGTPHHEDWVWSCNYGSGGHAVDKGGVNTGGASGFDQGRVAIYNAFRYTYHTLEQVSVWGNTREFKQCDGDYAGSNGYVYWYLIPNSYH